RPKSVMPEKTKGENRGGRGPVLPTGESPFGCSPRVGPAQTLAFLTDFLLVAKTFFTAGCFARQYGAKSPSAVRMPAEISSAFFSAGDIARARATRDAKGPSSSAGA